MPVIDAVTSPVIAPSNAYPEGTTGRLLAGVAFSALRCACEATVRRCVVLTDIGVRAEFVDSTESTLSISRAFLLVW